VKAGAVPVFIRLLSSENEELKEQALWACGNVAGDCTQYRDYCIELGIVPLLLNMLNTSDKVSLTRNAVWTISNVCRGKNPPVELSQVSCLLPLLVKQLFSTDVDILSDAVWAIAHLCEGTNDRIEAVIQSGATRRLVELLIHARQEVCSAALRAIGNIVTGDDSQTEAVLACSVLGCLKRLLGHPRENIKKEVCWTLSNVTAGSRAQIQSVIDEGIFPPLVEVLTHADFKTRKEACWAISNAVNGGSSAQVRHIIRCGTIAPLCDLLTVMDPRVVNVVLNGLDCILKHGEKDKKKGGVGAKNPYAMMVEEAFGLEKLEFLQQSPNLEIYVKAYDLIDAYFNSDETEKLDQGEQTFDFDVNPPTQSFSIQ